MSIVIERTGVIDLVPVVHESKAWEELFHSTHHHTAHSLFYGRTRLDGRNLNVDTGCREVLVGLEGRVVLLEHIDFHIVFQVHELSNLLHVRLHEGYSLCLGMLVLFNDTLILEVQIHTKLSNRSAALCVIHRHTVQDVRIVEVIEFGNVI